MPTEPEPTEPAPTPTPPPPADAGLGLDLFGEPIPSAEPGQVDAGDDQVDQDSGLSLNADEWAELDEVWDEPIGFEDQANMPARPVPKQRPAPPPD